MGQDKSQRADDVRRDLPKYFALDQRLTHQTKLVIFKIAQAAVHEFGRPGRRPAGQIIHFAQKNRIASPGRVARDTAPVDAATDDREIEKSVQTRLPTRRWPFRSAIWLSYSSKSQPISKANRKGDEPTLRPIGGCRPNNARCSRYLEQPSSN